MLHNGQHSQSPNILPLLADRTFGRRLRRTGSQMTIPLGATVRIEYAKGGKAAFFSHLDLTRIFRDALRRGDLPIAYSQGYHPRPKIGFGPPLPLGVEGEREYVDVKLSAAYRGDVMCTLGAELPDGIELRKVKSFIGKIPALSATINRAVYEVRGHLGPDLCNRLSRILQEKPVLVKRSHNEMVDIRPGIHEIEELAMGDGFRVVVTIGEPTSPRIRELLCMAVEADDPDRIALLKVVRTALFIERDRHRITPLEVVTRF